MGLRVIFFVAAALVATAGCRDLDTGSGGLDDQHILAGRGTPHLTDVERDQRWFTSADRDLSALRRFLRSKIGLSLELRGLAQPFANGLVTYRDPREVNPTRASDRVSLGAPFIPGIDLVALLDRVPGLGGDDPPSELQQLCGHALLGGAISNCDPLKSLSSVPMDDLEIELRRNGIRAHWDVPRHEARMNRRIDDHGECVMEDGALKNKCAPGSVCPRDDGEQVEGRCIWTRYCDGPGGHPLDPDLDCFDPRCTAWGGCDYEGLAPACDTETNSCVRYLEFLPDRSDVDPLAPVLALTLPFDLHLDPLDLLTPLIHVEVSELVVELRLQPIACSGAGCRMNGRTLFDRYRTPVGGLELSDAGIDVRARSRLVGRDFEIVPLPFCLAHVFPTEIIAPILPVPAGPLGSETIACLVVADILPEEIEKGLDSAARSVGQLVDAMLNPVALRIPSTGLPGWLTIDAAEARYATGVGTPGERSAPIAAPGGAWTNHTLDVLAKGGSFDFIEVNLAAPGSPMPAACAPCVAGASGFCPDICNDLCAGLPAACDLSAARICFHMHAGSPATCDGGLRFDTRGNLRSQLGAIAALSSTWNPTPEELQAIVGRIMAATAPIPASPNVATLFDAVPHLAHATQALFTAPLDRAFGGAARLTRALYCTDGDDRHWRCPDDAAGATFLFVVDRDGDGIPDEDDVCPEDADPDNVDTDGDGFCDNNDLCMWTPSPTNTRNFCDCDLDFDGCPNPLYGTPIESAPADVRRSCAPGPDGIYDKRPGVSDGGADLDGTGPTDDCDADVDGDMVPDDEDNCPEVWNREQEDHNGDGFGDLCDPLCPGPGAVCPDREDHPDFVPGHLIDAGIGAGLIPACLGDGPGCFDLRDFFAATCGAYGPGGLCVDFGFIDRRGGGFTQRLVELEGGLRAAVPLGDLDGDGLAELALAQLDAQGLGRVIALDGHGEVLWQVDGQQGFGAAMALGDGWLAVGAPEAGGGRGAVHFIGLGGETLALSEGKRLGGALGSNLAVIDGMVFSGAPGANRVEVVRAPGEKPRPAFSGKKANVQVGHAAVRGARLGGQDVLLVPTGGALLVLERKRHKVGKVLQWLEADPKWQFGAAMAAPADYDGDGADEIAIGAPGFANGAGAVFFLTAEGELVQGPIGSEGSAFGATLAALPDQNGDQRPDLAVGLPGGRMPTGQWPGAHVVLSVR